MKTPNKTGFSLVELMVALALSLVLAVAVFQIFLSDKTSYRIQEALSGVQENGRFAIEVLAREGRMAGYMLCITDPSVTQNLLNNSNTAFYSFNIAVGGSDANTDGTWSPSLDANLQNSSVPPLPGSDVLIIRYGGDDIIPVVAPRMPIPAAALHVKPNNGLKPCEIVMVTDCTAGTIFQITDANPDQSGTLDHNTGNACTNPGNAKKEFQKIYQPGTAFVLKANTKAFYIGNNPGQQPSLYEYNPQEGARELVEGIENMQVLYGVDTDNDATANIYQTASQVQNNYNWSQVVSIRIALLLRTIEDHVNVNVDTNTYNLLGYTFDPADDHRLRRIVTTTITLRNRVH